MNHRRILSFAALLLGSGIVLPTNLPAQNGIDPMHEIQEIAKQVDQQLQEIDRLLLESGRRDQNRQRPKELLQQARERSEEVEKGIDKLIDELNKLKQQRQQSSGQQSQDQQDQQDQQNQDQNQQQQQQQRQRNRRENQTPDIAQRPRDQKPDGGKPQGQQPEQSKPTGQQPTGGQETPDGGQNRRGDKPPDSEIGPAQPGNGDGSWGDLQPYANFLKNRGSMPQVPEKYRKYWEAYLKQKQDGKRK